MIQKNSLLRSFDNSGMSILKCMSVLSKSKESKLLDFIKFSIKKFSKYKKSSMVKVKKSIMYKGIILTQKLFYQSKNGFFMKFNLMKVMGVLNNKLLGSSMKGNILKEMKKLLFMSKKKSDLMSKIILKSKFIF